jgi:putative transcriptional regulator
MNTAELTSEDLLLRYAAGTLRPAPALVVASHLAMSKNSRTLIADYEALGGVVLEEEPLAEVGAGLFDATLALLDQPAPSRRETAPVVNDHLNMGIPMPGPLARRKIGPWRWMGPGMRIARVEMPEDSEHNLVLLRIPEGRALPMHSHSGSEYTLVLKGAFADASGVYRAGDLIEETEETDHSPIVEMGEECICLAAIEGPMRIRSWIGRLAQPFIGI